MDPTQSGVAAGQIAAGVVAAGAAALCAYKCAAGGAEGADGGEPLSFFEENWKAADPQGFATRADRKETILETISRIRLADVGTAEKELPLAQLKERVKAMTNYPIIDFYARLKSEAGRLAVLAEIKRASPSKEWIAKDIVAAEQGLTYATAGAAAISVLCEPHWFKGHLEDMKAVREIVDALPNRPAVLRKDFLLSEYQLWEARLWGADTVLLIVAILTDAELSGLMAVSRQLKMEPLVEVANEAEMERAVALEARVIGINNRNLHDFSVDMANTTNLTAGLIARHPDTIFLALSGLTDGKSAAPYRLAGVQGILVGEALMKAPDVTEAFKDLQRAGA